VAGDASRRNGAKPGRPRGRPKGSITEATRRKIELHQQFKDRVAAEFGPLLDAQMEAAKGVSHMLALDKETGQFVRVTSPKKMLEVLNSGSKWYRIYAQNPDVRALKDIFDRVLGTPTQSVELSGPEGHAITFRWEGDDGAEKV